MNELFKKQYAKQGNKIIPVLRKYVGITSAGHPSSSEESPWNSYICGCNGGGGCDACDD